MLPLGLGNVCFCVSVYRAAPTSYSSESSKATSGSTTHFHFWPTATTALRQQQHQLQFKSEVSQIAKYLLSSASCARVVWWFLSA
jgi:hypothetical protein